MTQATPPSSDTKASPAPSHGGVKETLESILVAFILAFIFRAFVVEAFVIPTGSMAPTLLGAHMRFACRDCGYPFDVNFDSPGEDMNIPDRAVGRRYYLNCPNCGYPVPGGPGGSEPGDATEPPVRYGDRILVLKYLYLLQDPQRWDVVVFKSPYLPRRYHYTQNYIKRLVGLPGETVMILDGDIFVAKKPGPADQLKPDDFTVQTKPPHVQEALWRIVNDNDYFPQGLTSARWVQPWQLQDGAGWTHGNTPAAGREFRFDNPTGAGTLEFNSFTNRATRALTDWLAYNQASPQQPDSRTGESVGDLKLDLVYQRTAGDGPLRLKLTKREDAFVAEFTPTTVQLLRATGKADPTPLGAPVPLPDGSSSMRIEFQNVDYQVTVRVNGQVLCQTTPQQYRPDVTALLEAMGQRSLPPVVQIAAGRQKATISHLSLWRDVHYLNAAGQPLWASPRPHGTPGGAFTDRLFRLGDEPGKREYFVLGDNSLISGDARFWDTPIDLPAEGLEVDPGRVPERFLLGKAFFVYWPAGFPAFTGTPNIIPNFGEMRFIH